MGVAETRRNDKIEEALTEMKRGFLQLQIKREELENLCDSFQLIAEQSQAKSEALTLILKRVRHINNSTRDGDTVQDELDDLFAGLAL